MCPPEGSCFYIYFLGRDKHDANSQKMLQARSEST